MMESREPFSENYWCDELKLSLAICEVNLFSLKMKNCIFIYTTLLSLLFSMKYSLWYFLLCSTVKFSESICDGTY